MKYHTTEDTNFELQLKILSENNPSADISVNQNRIIQERIRSLLHVYFTSSSVPHTKLLNYAERLYYNKHTRGNF